MEDTASPLVGCGKEVMTAIKRLIADCTTVHAKKSGSFGTAAISKEIQPVPMTAREIGPTNNYGNGIRKTTKGLCPEATLVTIIVIIIPRKTALEQCQCGVGMDSNNSTNKATPVVINPNCKNKDKTTMFVTLKLQ